jgi:hypothetical protein
MLKVVVLASLTLLKVTLQLLTFTPREAIAGPGNVKMLVNVILEASQASHVYESKYVVWLKATMLPVAGSWNWMLLGQDHDRANATGTAMNTHRRTVNRKMVLAWHLTFQSSLT